MTNYIIYVDRQWTLVIFICFIIVIWTWWIQLNELHNTYIVVNGLWWCHMTTLNFGVIIKTSFNSFCKTRCVSQSLTDAVRWVYSVFVFSELGRMRKWSDKISRQNLPWGLERLTSRLAVPHANHYTTTQTLWSSTLDVEKCITEKPGVSCIRLGKRLKGSSPPIQCDGCQRWQMWSVYSKSCYTHEYISNTKAGWCDNPSTSPAIPLLLFIHALLKRSSALLQPLANYILFLLRPHLLQLSIFLFFILMRILFILLLVLHRIPPADPLPVITLLQLLSSPLPTSPLSTFVFLLLHLFHLLFFLLKLSTTSSFTITSPTFLPLSAFHLLFLLLRLFHHIFFLLNLLLISYSTFRHPLLLLPYFIFPPSTFSPHP